MKYCILVYIGGGDIVAVQTDSVVDAPIKLGSGYDSVVRFEADGEYVDASYVKDRASVSGGNVSFNGIVATQVGAA